MRKTETELILCDIFRVNVKINVYILSIILGLPKPLLSISYLKTCCGRFSFYDLFNNTLIEKKIDLEMTLRLKTKIGF